MMRYLMGVIVALSLLFGAVSLNRDETDSEKIPETTLQKVGAFSGGLPPPTCLPPLCPPSGGN